MKKAKKIILSFIAVAALAVTPLVFSFDTYADAFCDRTDITDEVKKQMGCSSSNTIDNSIVKILNVVIGAAALVTVVYIVIGGVNYLTSAGDPGKVKKAKDTIIYALIGLVVCAMAFAIVNYALTGINN